MITKDNLSASLSKMGSARVSILFFTGLLHTILSNTNMALSLRMPREQKKAIKELHRSFSDFSFTIKDLLFNEDKVWGRMTVRGIQTGQFGQMPPTGKKIEASVIDIIPPKDGKLAEHRDAPDRMAMMEQPDMKLPLKIIMKTMRFLHR